MNRTPKLPARIQRRNAQFQQWQALLTNRRKRSRSGQMLIQGVRPLSQALEHGVELIALLADDRPQRSRWARDILERAPVPIVELPGELLAELGQRDEGPPELLGVAALPGDDLARLDRLLRSAPSAGDRRGPLGVFDRPRTPGNIGSPGRTGDALGGGGPAGGPPGPRPRSGGPWSPSARPVARSCPRPRGAARWCWWSATRPSGCAPGGGSPATRRRRSPWEAAPPRGTPRSPARSPCTRRVASAADPHPVPRARATNGPPRTPSSGPASSTGPKANLCPGRRLIMSTTTPTTPPSTAIPSREASSTSPPSAAEVATTTGSVFASPIPITDGASRATRTAPMPITTASTAALRIVGRRAGWSSAIRARTTATRTVSVATHRLGSRCSRTSTQASTEAGGTYAAASASRGRRGSAITRTFQQIPRRSAAGGARLWTSGADRRRGGQICGGCPRVERTRMIRRRIHIFLAPLT